MSSLYSHNYAAMTRWLNRYFPDIFQGSPDPDQNYDDNKKQGRALLKSGLLDTLDDPLLYASHRLLMHLFFEWLPEEDPEAALACRFSVLNPNTAGGMVELERWEALGGEPKETAKIARRGLKSVGKVLSADTAAERFARFLPADGEDREAFVEGGAILLAVGEDERCASWQEGHNRDIGRKRTFDAHDRYRAMCRELEAVIAEEPGRGVDAAIALYRQRLKEEKRPDVSRATVYAARAFCRGEVEADPTFWRPASGPRSEGAEESA